MRWVRIRRASIPKDERDVFERFGTPVIGGVLAGGFAPRAEELHPVYNTEETRKHAAQWLTEQYDRAERKETWSLTMEAAITVFVAVELVFSVLNFVLH